MVWVMEENITLRMTGVHAQILPHTDDLPHFAYVVKTGDSTGSREPLEDCICIGDFRATAQYKLRLFGP
jgi:hypothetical protein